MLSFLFLGVLWASCMTAPLPQYSFSPAVGSGGGTAFSTENENGPITGIRLWENRNSYIAGLQLRYGFGWGQMVGRELNSVQELILNEGESFIQVSGKYHSNYIYQLIFVTSSGRSLIVGQPITLSFNFYPSHPGQELVILSGTHNTAGLLSIAAHWAVPQAQYNSTNQD
ncbi:zymogen granule membrane protein 16-like [Pseudochaenichthys georgianus]|uniref:zymogen granule membrane protein 16-like n=1 Tax=Pseudochaenichthys georgianus TaxID=52239 RepID=UPI00146B75B0|nr:zymogen granule membrane protein 16-like [Pseudochaenichthys georgianus]XP_033959213.1 zymogen granule membrane protein 16-like [Pseudochaenichthys georgianus]XP_033959215.1 zymogen granule membrane protein 16-like [Pseudochaenichthys georgianus]XP_033959240.1 zymogen granule membrane protein 16-like [Pseudochaenichthys georgianus]